MAAPSADVHGVRFAADDEEIAPDDTGLEHVRTLTGHEGREREELNPEAARELEQLRTTLQNNIQSSRMQHHAFEPVSLPGSQPASRVPSGTTTPSRSFLPAGSGAPSPRRSPPSTNVHSPPLTPAATQSRDGKGSVGGVSAMRQVAPNVMTPQRSVSPQRSDKPSADTAASVEAAAGVAAHPKPTPRFSIGPSPDSQPQSKDVSPAGTPANTAPGTPRPFTPAGAPINEPNAIPKRLSQPNRNSYRFGDRDPTIGYANSGQSNVSLDTIPNAPNLPRSSGATGSAVSLPASDGKRSSIFGGIKRASDDGSSTMNEKDSHSSKSNLKRFFKFGSDNKHKEKHGSSNGGSKEASKSASQSNVPFADDHGLISKYGKFGKMLGSGAGGSVRLMKRTGDGTVFAVKQFRDRHAYESEKDYNKKVTAEFCIGSTLHHGNVIETIDIVQEKGKWYEVMEYAPYDLFATVMTGKMGREETYCSTLQILAGVCYLHSMGMAHRDLKLDNVVINDQGIMKLIDFGSAVIFRYPFENDIVLATGVVGSDPYLAPEVYDQSRYDPRPTDVWSIAIIFCCMMLRRFPWKAPRLSDNSYRLFVSTPDPDQERLLDEHRRSLTGERQAQTAPASRNASVDDTANGETHRHHHHHHDNTAPKNETVSRQSTQSNDNNQPVIKGPLRLLRLLPRETRHIIGRMLELDPKKRADMNEILEDAWVQNSLVCRQEENGVIIKAPNHTHTMQPSNPQGK
ncbi:Nitrogen permease reactivator protein [Elasticomyces elasticus]|nr:Nitrogen permease reactivator protein [Elasticomyces elasticus]KAK4980220.1 Nitrogen permease reactivator protein [Elasticomyces elasticus]